MMDTDSEYYQQLQVINQMLEQTPEGPERDELNSLRENIEELLLLTEQSTSTVPEGKSSSSTQDNEKSESNSPVEDAFAEEYALFMAEMTQEGAIKSQDIKEDHQLEECTNSNSLDKLKELEGKKFRAPHAHQWGQMAYHNAMVCSVPQVIPGNELQVKVLFLNPTHKEMLPCPYYFDLEKDCHFTEDQCRFSHGELVPFSSLQDYIEPKFENLTIGSEVLAKQSDDLWYRGKIAQISKEKCLVKFESRNIQNENFEEIVFKHILPLDQSENSSGDSGSDSDMQVAEVSDDEESKRKSKKRDEELINSSLMVTPDTVPLGDWEKYTKGIGSKLMQKMGYIVGTGLGKEGSGIIKPVTALILPQGKSLDFCMNLKEKSKDPHLFHADKKSSILMKKKGKKPSRKMIKLQIKLEQMDLEKFIIFYFSRGMFAVEKKERRLLREKLKVATTKEINVADFIIEKRIKTMIEKEDDLKTSIQRIEEKQAEPKALYKKLSYTRTTLKRMKIFRPIVLNELDRRKNNKEMAVF